MIDSSRVVEQAEAILRRVSPEGRRSARRARQRRLRGVVRKLQRAAIAMLVIAFAAGMIGWLVTPLGMEGLMLAAIAMALAVATILFWPSAPEPTSEVLLKSELAALPSKVEEWLEHRRPELPSPASRAIDSIGRKLEGLAPQLALLDSGDPAAAEIRKLLSDELPELVEGYRRVPQALRREAGAGTSANDQLLEGLNVVDNELARMSEQLARGDLHRLATQGRFLELKYRGGE